MSGIREQCCLSDCDGRWSTEDQDQRGTTVESVSPTGCDPGQQANGCRGITLDEAAANSEEPEEEP